MTTNARRRRLVGAQRHHSHRLYSRCTHYGQPHVHVQEGYMHCLVEDGFERKKYDTPNAILLRLLLLSVCLDHEAGIGSA